MTDCVDQNISEEMTYSSSEEVSGISLITNKPEKYKNIQNYIYKPKQQKKESKIKANLNS
jgi:hypothetical protein